MEEITEKQIEDLRSLKDKYISDGNITYRIVRAAPRGVMALPLDAAAEVADLWDKRSDGYRPAERLYPKDFHTGKYSLLSDAEAKAAVDRYHADVERLDGEMQREYTGAQKPAPYYVQVAYIDSEEDREILDRYVGKEDYSRLLSDAEDYASADDYEFDLADTFKNDPAHYPGDSLIASNGKIAVVQNRVGDYAVFFETDKSHIKENLYNYKRGRYAVNEDFPLDYEHEWSDDVKEIIEEMRNERREKALVKRLGEGFHWKAQRPSDAIEIGVEERLDDRITGIDVENGHLKLHGDTATAGGPNAHDITVTSLSEDDMSKIYDFAMDYRRDKVLNDPTYRPVKKVWDVIGQKGSEYETIKSGLTDKAATNFVARHTADYGRKGYDTIYSVPTYIIDRRYKGVSIPSAGRWHGEKQKEWKVGAGFRENLAAIESKGAVNGTPVKDGKIKIPQDYFYPDRHAAVSAILSADAMNHDYGLVEYYDLEDIYHSGLRIKEDAQPVYIPDYMGDETIGVKEVYPAEMTDFAEKAVIDDSYRTRFHNTIINSMNRREDTFPVRQLAFLNKDGGLDVSDRDKAVKDLETIDARFDRYLSGESVEEGRSQKETEAQTEDISLSGQDEVSKENEQEESQERERPRGLRL